MINVGGSFIFYFFEWLCLGVETFKIYTYQHIHTNFILTLHFYSVFQEYFKKQSF